MITALKCSFISLTKLSKIFLFSGLISLSHYVTLFPDLLIHEYNLLSMFQNQQIIIEKVIFAPDPEISQHFSNPPGQRQNFLSF